MYFLISTVLFWAYWLIALATAILVVRELFHGNWKAQASAALTLIPLLLRVFLIK